MEEIARVTGRNLLLYGYDEDGETGFMDMEDGLFVPLEEGAEVLGDDALLYRVEDGEWELSMKDSDTPCPHCGGFGPATGGGEPGYEDEPCHAPFVSEEYRRRNPCSGCPADADRSVCLSTMAAGNCPLP